MNATAIKERPILFSRPMVNAIINGTKSQTRRVVKPQPSIEFDLDAPVFRERSGVWCHPCAPQDECIFDEPQCEWWRCPYGGRLWVRETHAINPMLPASMHKPKTSLARHVRYRADGVEPWNHWQPSIHMPRWASRIALEITGVRVEQVQAISEADAIAEGCPRPAEQTWWQGYREFDGELHHQQAIGEAPPDWMIEPHRMGFKGAEHLLSQPVPKFRNLWDSINAKRGYPWASNPFVWVVEFKRIGDKQ